jgi:hypothetical protein
VIQRLEVVHLEEEDGRINAIGKFAGLDHHDQASELNLSITGVIAESNGS